ncbi:relaxase/mobilization nuclease domain-containing protein [Nocardia yamanashiensis]|uniref:relaxase/mobilization nuclease domain-containing protein n=1 Tax=Nocardia yamanashiensis TaxID=209247 RepID=UPI0008339E73|nr:hypothetical protein [Nocardia yamanashiensis]
MIPKIRRGAKLAGLVAYLLGPGEHNEHTDRHVVAGSPTVMREMWLERFDGPGDDEAARETALAVAHEIEIPRRLYKTPVRMKAKAGVGGRDLGMDVFEPARKGEDGVLKDAPVWHCVLALMPREKLSDEKWEQVAEAFMERMGFTGTPDGKRAQARWVAVRHGLSGADGEGQDHIHIAASLIREDGSKVSTYDYGPGKAKGDWKRADEVCGELEHEFGLQVLASRAEGGGLSGHSRAEIERQKRLGTPETERERLRRSVRAIATAAESEADFVHGLRSAGIAVRPFYKAGGTEEVTGYSVRMRRDGAEIGPWLGGGKLAGDLALPALRGQQWDDSPAGRDAALQAWKNHTDTPRRSQRPGPDTEVWREAIAEIGQWQQQLADVPHGDRAQWAWIAGQAAGAFAAWSEVLEGDQPGAFAAAHRELTRSAQVNQARDRYRPPPGTHPTVFADVARLLLADPQRGKPAARPPLSDPVSEVAVLLLALMLLLLLALIAIAQAVAGAHRSRGELWRAAAVENMTYAQLGPVRTAWENEHAARLFEWDRDAAQVFTAAAGRAADKALDSMPEPAAAQSKPGPRDPDKVLAAASGPLTPPTDTGVPRPRLRTFYTDLTPQEKSSLRNTHVAAAGFADLDLAPQDWSDEKLAAELTHRREELRVLAADLDDRARNGGPRTRTVRAENETTTAQARLIPDAQAARDAAGEAERQLDRLETEHARLAQELAELPKRRMLARQKAQAELTQAEEKLQRFEPVAQAAREAADTTATATGVLASEWNNVLRRADPAHQKYLLRGAHDEDAREIRDDHTHLRNLQSELEKVETEHARRAKLTPEQQAAEAVTRGQDGGLSRPRQPRVEPGRGAQAARRPSTDLGRGRGKDHGIGM